MVNSTLFPKFKSSILTAFLSSLILALHFTTAVHAQNEPDATTLKCASHLFGTMSKDDCAKTCNIGADKCKLMTKVNGAAGGEVTDCYACPTDLSCHDIGADDWIDCFKCNLNPKTECIKAGFMPPGGFPGAPGGGPIGGKTPGGTQCYKCVNKTDKCPAPSTWFKTCMTNCALPKQCVLSGKDVNGFDCYTCKDNKAQTCKELGLLSNADCAACNAKPNMQCAPAGFTKEFQACFQCVAKPKPPQPDTCQDYGLEINCNVCIDQGKGCEFIDVDENLTCALCHEKKKAQTPACQSPDFDSSGCQACEKDGGVCIGRTTVRGEIPCYYCYKNITEKTTGCAAYGLPNSCSPNPCLEGESCAMFPMDDTTECGICYNAEDIVGTNYCKDHKYENDCATCYKVGLACRAQFMPELGANCYDCYRPREAETCEEMGWSSTCDPSPCHEGEVCVPYEVKKDFYCATCSHPDDVVCPEETIKGRCTETSCPSYQGCVEDYGCHYCYDKTCSDFNLESDCKVCAQNGMDCNSVSPHPNINCVECVAKKMECPAGAEPGGCSENACGSNEVCTPSGDCHSCEPKKVEEVRCKDGFAEGTCNESTCGTDSQCVQDGKCFVCERKEIQAQRCDEKGLLYADGCNTCLEFGKNCNPAEKDDFGIQCFQCADKPKTAEDRCNAGYAPGKCLSITCSADERCEEDTKAGQKVCHKCVPLKTTTGRQCNTGMFSGTCPGVCAEKELGCAPSGLGDGCYYCTYKETHNQCPLGLWPGQCPGTCDSDTSCVQSGNCYACVLKKEYIETQCPEGAMLGMCPGICKPDEQCNIAYGNPNCYTCSPQKDCVDYNLMSSCSLCGWRGQDCQAVNLEIGLECFQCVQNSCRPHLTKEECGKCEWDDADCAPVDKNGRFYPKGMTVEKGTGPQCYDCDYGERCSDYGLVCDCTACPRGTMCVPTSDRLYDGKQCYACVKEVKKVGEYVVIIIEPMYERYVLKGNKEEGAGGLGNFVGRKVMALAKVDDVNGIKQIAGLLKGGMNIANIVPINMESLTSTLQQSLTSGGKFSDNCFKDFKAVEPQEKLPVGTKSPEKKKKDEPAPQISEGYGENPLEHVTMTGPVIACGESQGKKALMILGADGNPTGIITQEVAKKSPDALKAAMQKAQETSETFLALKNGGWKNMVKKFAGGFVDRGVSEVKEVVKDKKKKKKTEPEVQIDPNDPLYEKPEKGKKKKFLGILGGDAPSTPVILGSGQKFGGQVMGAGSGEKEEPKVDYQWGLYKIGYTPKSDPQSAWNAVNADEKNVIVAVIDSGLDLTHPDGPRYVWKNPGETPDNKIDDDQNGYVDDVQGWSFLDNNNDLRDFRGHGTFVAGIIAARSDNGQGIAGINPGAIIMPLKVANAEGEANSFNIYRAIHYAVSHGARVINVSMGARSISLMEQAAINYAREMNVFVAIASGNVGENIGDHGPASAFGAFSVGAIDISGERSTISNWGGNNGLLAPAEEVYSLLSADAADRVLPSLRKLGYYTQSGTSFSTPMVAATASLILAKHPNFTPADIEDILQRTATDMYEAGWDGKSGAGLLNAAAALRDETKSTLTVKLVKLQKNLDDNKKFDSIDVTATVRGDLDQFTVSVGRGIHPGKFEQVAGPFRLVADNDWVARIDKSSMRGSTDWVVRIEAQDRTGKVYTAQSAVDLK